MSKEDALAKINTHLSQWGLEVPEDASHWEVEGNHRFEFNLDGQPSVWLVTPDSLVMIDGPEMYRVN